MMVMLMIGGVNVAPMGQREHVPFPVVASPLHQLSQACDEP